MTKKSTTKKTYIIIAAALLIVSGCGFYAYKRSQQQPAPASVKTYPGPTEEEKQEAQNNKEALIKSNEERTTPQTNPDGQKKSVTPVVTSAYQVDANITITAYTPGIFENGGTCTMKATKSGQEVTKTSEAFANATTTDCAPFLLKKADFPLVGDWSVVVSYSSPTAEGVSQSKTLTLQ